MAITLRTTSALNVQIGTNVGLFHWHKYLACMIQASVFLNVRSSSSQLCMCCQCHAALMIQRNHCSYVSIT